MEILFIKTSSLGDVIHHMPALTEARRHRPDARFTWAVEEAYAPLLRMHEASPAVVAVGARRWRRAFVSPGTWDEARSFAEKLRMREYDAIIDTQGLIKSAVIARIAQGPRHGYDRNSIREPIASHLYNVRHTVSRDLHAIERNRRLTGLVLGYQPSGEPDYGLNRTRLASPPDRYAVFLHATARTEKEWPEADWIALGRALADTGCRYVLPWGEGRERARSERLAAALAGSEIPERRPLDDVARLIAGAAFVVGVDTGLVHLAAAMKVPLVAIFAGSEPGLTGPVGTGPMKILGGKGEPPSVAAVTDAVREVLRQEPPSR
jgi:heptosyltransferase-1